jgi:dUTP pyrophosphatase
MSIRVPIKRLEGNTDLPLPRYLSAGAVGLDLHAAVTDSVAILPGEVSSIPCGLAIGLPSGFEGQVRPRSGLAVKHSISILNAPGTIDSDYRGEIKVLLINLGSEVFRVERGMRVAQLLSCRYRELSGTKSMSFLLVLAPMAALVTRVNSFQLGTQAG